MAAKKRKMWMVTLDGSEHEIVVRASTERRARLAAQVYFNDVLRAVSRYDEENLVGLDEVYANQVDFVEGK